MRRAVFVLLATLLAPGFVAAVPRRAPGRLAPRRVPARAPAPRPVVDLQVTGLDTGGERRFHAVYHAIRRDAVPALAACIARAPGARGYAAVALDPTIAGRHLATVATNLPVDLARCVEAAVGAIDLPPREVIDDAPTAESVPAPEAPVRFEVRVRLPRVGAR